MSDNEANEKAKKHSDKDIGQLFADERKNKNLSIEDIVEEIKIRPVYIRAIEEGDFDKLPSGVYRKTYIKSYCDILNLDYEEISQNINPDNDEEKKEKSLEPEPYRNELSPAIYLVLISLTLVVAVYFVWSNNYKEDNLKTIENIVEKHEKKVIEQLIRPNPEVTIVAIENTKILILNSAEEIILEKDLLLGDTYFLPKEKNLILKVEDKNTIEIYIDGEIVVSTDNLEKKLDGLVLDINKMLANIEVN